MIDKKDVDIERKTVLRDPVTEKLTRKCYHIATENTNNIPMGDFNTLTATCMVCG